MWLLFFSSCFVTSDSGNCAPDSFVDMYAEHSKVIWDYSFALFLYQSHEFYNLFYGHMAGTLLRYAQQEVGFIELRRKTSAAR